MILEDYRREKIKGLDKRDIESVKKYTICPTKAKHDTENASCPLYEKSCNNMLYPMLFKRFVIKSGISGIDLDVPASIATRG